MAIVRLGRLFEITQARYVIHLSDKKRLVLFRLPVIEPSKQGDRAANETDDGWTYYAMEAECPHAGGPMQDSQIDIEDSAYVASCPWHAYDFNVETGESSVGIKACTFPVDVRGEYMTLLYDSEDGSDVSLVKLEPVTEKIKLKKDRASDKKIQSTQEHLQALQLEPGSAKYLDENATVCDWCAHILNTSNPEHKIELTAHLFTTFTEKERSSSPMPLGRGTVLPPAQPPREGLSEVKPWAIPKSGRGGTLKSRISMLHALANIELWAIDLAVDICVRFATFQTETVSKCDSRVLPRSFFHDWLKVANDEAKHFSLLRARMEEMGSYFGALPVHHGLWESATITAHDLRARISIIALVHEARGLDVNPMTIEKFRRAGDAESVQCLEVIHNDEITHVTTGHRWLSWVCQEEGTDPVQVFRSNVRKYFRGNIKEPFNAEARAQAGLDERYYENLEGVPVA
ncbi:hypothetical protein BDV29DRAFT_62324 [Aspergillus leporis]|uniref:Rieske domain-containing protein n=1 Tax=Aspergillus leporis TaxID=41062 RepID=A0A5N5WJY9_9EURO|nr:hypothetical protein BDV29DRAFT_62324 [Aspergillus leporis]